MRKIGILVIFILAFIFNIGIASAITTSLTNYTEIGAENGYFQRGIGRFNQNFAGTFGLPTITSAVLSNGREIPLVADLDNDGINEIIVLDGATIKLYHGKNFVSINSYSLGSSGAVSNMLAYDIDNDNKLELILARNTNKDILILSYNGTSFVNQTALFFARTYIDGETAIKCSAPNSCIIAYGTNLHANGTTTHIFARGFNSTNISGEFQTSTTGAGSTAFCFPHIKDIQAQDFNTDGIMDYVFTAINGKTAGDNVLNIIYLDVLADLSISAVSPTLITKSGFTSGGSGFCDTDNYGKYITSPLVFDAVTGDGLETIVAYMVSSSTYKIQVFDKTGTLVDTHPSVQTADGEILSNPIKMNAFPMDKTGIVDKQNDFCVMGFIRNNMTLNLLCGSQQSSFGTFSFDTIEYFASESYNVSFAYDNNAIISHQVNEQDNNVINTNIMDNLLNTYGTYTLTNDDCNVAGCGFIGQCNLNTQCKMTKIFSNPETNSVVISVDEEKETLEDLIAMTTGNIFYLDDKYSNSKPVICPNTNDCSYSPCSPIKTNTTGQVTIRATDIDINDKVSYRLISYKGTANEQDTGFGANVSSGTSVTFTFFANQTIGNGILSLQATDNFNPSGHISSYADLSFSATDNGFVLGDCTQSLQGTTIASQAPADATGIITAIQPDNAITSGTGALATTFGLSSQIIWIILMIVIAIALWFYSHMAFPNLDSSAIFGLTAFVELLMFILGALLGFISFGIIIIIVLIGILILSFWIRKKMSGTPN